MMYVDLNPVRAGINDTLEGSDFTSIQDRLFSFAEQENAKTLVSSDKDKAKCPLLAFKGNESLVNDALKGLPFSLLDYFELIDWTGRAIRDDKKGAIPANIAPILQKLGVAEGEWVGNVNHFGRRFYSVVGSVAAMRQFSDRIGQWWMLRIPTHHEHPFRFKMNTYSDLT